MSIEYDAITRKISHIEAMARELVSTATAYAVAAETLRKDASAEKVVKHHSTVNNYTRSDCEDQIKLLRKELAKLGRML